MGSGTPVESAEPITTVLSVPVGGVPHYVEWVSRSRVPGGGERPVMVFVHGWGGSARYWRTTAAWLSDRFDCLLYDLRGFGRSPLPDPVPEPRSPVFSMEAYGADLRSLLDALGVERAIVNGHSMGASIAAVFAAQYPERLERLILTCSGIFEYDRLAFETFYLFGSYVVKVRPKWMAAIPFAPKLFMGRFLHRPLPNADCLAFLEDFLAADYGAALGTIYTSVSLEAVKTMPGVFAGLRMPTLLLSGQYDQIIPAELGRRAAVCNGDRVSYRVLPATGHFPMLEDPATYRATVNAFLAP